MRFFPNFIVIILMLLFPVQVFSQNLKDPDARFSTNYNIEYDVEENGVTSVKETITLKNLTDKYFASDFSLVVGSTQISDVFASDTSGSLPLKVETSNSSTKINVSLTQQVAGVGKEYKWSLGYKSKDFAQKTGNVWQVAIPKLATTNDQENYNLSLAVPVSFGDPNVISPKPWSEKEAGGKLIFIYNKEQLQNSGILAHFGDFQQFKFSLGYFLENSNFNPIIKPVHIPANFSGQKVYIANIDPKPENVTIDEEGNYLAWFTLKSYSKVNIAVEGFIQRFQSSFDSTKISNTDFQKFIQPLKYWEKNNPLIKSKGLELFKNQLNNKLTNTQKAKIINQYISDNLKYNYNEGKFQRLGSLTALSNPNEVRAIEFSDLFITLARSEGIPARMVLGYALSTNQNIRPLAIPEANLHVWTEFYDQSSGWVSLDSAWQNTTGGVDYFSHSDLNRVAIAKFGFASELGIIPSNVKFEFSQEPIKIIPVLNLTINSKDHIFAGLPFKAKIKVANLGNFTTSGMELNFHANKLQVLDKGRVSLPPIPPGGNIELEFRLKSPDLFGSYQDLLQLSLGDQKIQKAVQVDSLISTSYFSAGLVTAFGSMLLLYFGLFIHHILSQKSNIPKEKKKENKKTFKAVKNIKTTNKKFKKKK